jgi:hypothetical protein
MSAPGGGAGNKAAAVSLVKAVMPTILRAAMAFDSGSKEQQALLRAAQALNPVFGKAGGDETVPAAVRQIAMNAQRGGPMANAPTSPIEPAPPMTPPTSTPATGPGAQT